MFNAHSKRQKDIKSKLMAAICMLLVSSIMMVSTTYAWFTLSTAPEVTGINTAVGANGNLEMALMPKTGGTAAIGTGVIESDTPLTTRNTAWGNLVQLSTEKAGEEDPYGLKNIVLYPAALNLDETEPNKLAATGMLATPKYGADGRVFALEKKTTTAVHGEDGFMPGDGETPDYGVRAVGNVSGMTDRQLTYRDARIAASTAKGAAQKAARDTLLANGSVLANMAVNHGLHSGDTAKDVYTWTEIKALEAMIADLEDAMASLDEAYVNYILAYAASAQNQGENGITDAEVNALESAVDGGATLAALTEGEDALISVPADLAAPINAYKTTAANVAAAKAAMPTLPETDDGTTRAWDTFSGALRYLMDTSAVTVNGLTVDEVKADPNALVKKYTEEQGLYMTISTGGGVFADVADQTGEYQASITMDIEYGGMSLTDVPATMKTKTTVGTPYLDLVGTAVTAAGSPAAEGDAAQPISDIYGYVVDLAFRTNAAASNLLLEVDGVDRIYDENNNEDTMGHGSSMTFKATGTSFSDDQVKALMKAIRIVFFDPTERDIYAYAKLVNVDNAELGADGLTAKMTLYTPGGAGTTTYQYTEATDGTYKQVTKYVPVTAGYTGTQYTAEGVVTENGGYMPQVTYELAEEGYAGAKYTRTESTGTAEGDTIRDDKIITALNQNDAKQVSVLVYLDGEHVTNKDVATAATSMAGTMNLQFASDATLVPMEYADLHTPNGDGTGSNGGTAPEDGTYNVSVASDSVSGVSVTPMKAEPTKDYTFSLTGTTEGTTYTVTATVDGQPVTVTPGTGNYTISSTDVTGDITIKVVATS